MKLIDRYMLSTVLLPLGICLAAFALLYVVYDLFQNLQDFMQSDLPAVLVAKYYAIMLPSVFVMIVPVAMLLAVLYALSQLTKNNELTAMRASGVSLLRMMIPLLGVGVTLSGAVAAINEYVGPAAAFWCNNFIRLQGRSEEEVFVVRGHAFKMESERRVWYVNEFDIRTNVFHGIEVIQQREDGSDAAKTVAATAQYLDRRWWFTDAMVQRYDPEGFPEGPPKFLHGLEMPELSETPADFISDIKDPVNEPLFVSALDMHRYIQRNPQLDPKTVARLQVELHRRFALPWATLVVAMLGIPFGNQTGRRGALLGIALSIGMLVAYYILMNICALGGKTGLIPPWVAAWLPNLIFSAIGIVLLSRMR